MATKNRIAYALPIIQIMKILYAKSNKQMRLRIDLQGASGNNFTPTEKPVK